MIRSLDPPRDADARALAESLGNHFAIASISGSGGEHEVQFVNPPELVAVIGPSHARFFVQDVEGADGTRIRHEEQRAELAPEPWRTVES
ncbi:hypothetical protein QHF89_45535 [Polyangium sorediatum]|uniref:Uncharacterized protein n=1 Tax=Polyangium sorediatum TaxID=889274 RepID=A0ABT6P8I6_9BACT|nr:hypothetical protein [Polyangium sorediatum]